MKWRFIRKMCSATILTKSNYTLLSTDGNHEHPIENKIELQVFKKYLTAIISNLATLL
jgi:hypothetical protein